MNFQGFLDFFQVIFMVVFVVALAYGTTWMIGKKSNSVMGGKNAKVLQQVSVNMSFQITVLQIQQKVYIIGKTNKSLELLDTIPLDQWKENEAVLLNQQQENRRETPLERLFKVGGPWREKEREKGDED